MSSILDPAKLKVVELRSELTNRGLDSKGNKPALVKRLKEALEAELKQDLPDTSIADTSTEDADSSVVDETAETANEEKEEPKVEVPEEIPKELDEEVATPVEESAIPEEENSTEQNDIPSNQQEVPVEDEKPAEEQPETIDEPISNVESTPENGEHKPEDEENREDNVPKAETEVTNDEIENNKMETDKKESDNEQKGEKRKHSSPSPDRSQRKRSKSPIKEDEPQIDTEKVQLNWYDSDLHLQVDKESFLSAKPLHEGAFGYAWAGVRATHGVSSGKVCYEVKITEELKWEDLSKIQDRSRRDSHRSSSSSHRNNSDKKSDTKDETKDDNKEQTNTETSTQNESEEKSNEQENTSENTENNSEEKMEVDETKKEEETVTNEEKSDTNETNPTETVEKPEPKEIPSHLLRVGWSLLNSDLQLGENEHSFAYESSARFVINKEFQEYAIQFGVGDVIGAFLSIDDENIVITYTVNGVVQPNAGTLPRSRFPEENFVIFPHVLSRNYVFEVNLGNMEEPWFPVPIDLQDYEFLSKMEEKVAGPARPENRSDCEVILMCGLPSSGKTHWVQEHLKTNQDKKYTVIGNTHFLDKMTVSGTPLKNNFTGRWSVMLDKLQKCLTKLTELAALRRRNYIIDQTNVFPSAQRRKLRPFEGFKRRAVVVVVGDEEYARRQALQEAEDGKDVPDTNILEMKANMSIPQKSDWVDEIEFAELDEAASKEQVQKYNSAGRAAGYGIQRRFDRRDNRFQNRRNDHRGGKNYRDRNFHNNRYNNRGGNGPRHGNWHHGGGGGGGGGGYNRNRRDSRGPPPPPMGGRDWRRNRDMGGRPNDRNRDNRNQMNNYNRNRNSGGSSGGRSQGNWQSSSGGGGGWGPAGQGGGWSTQGYGQWGQNWSQASQNQWKYGGGGGQGYGAYGNWNYYQYPQSWSGQQGQSQSGGGGGSSSGGGNSGSLVSNTSSSGNGAAAQYSSQGYSQQAWAQYAQQYAQQAAGSTTQSTQPK